MILPWSNQNTIRCYWVYKLKFKPNGTIDCYKAHLAMKGFHQTHGFDFLETFSFVVKLTTIHVVLSLALSRNWSIQQLDVHCFYSLF